MKVKLRQREKRREGRDAAYKLCKNCCTRRHACYPGQGKAGLVVVVVTASNMDVESAKCANNWYDVELLCLHGGGQCAPAGLGLGRQRLTTPVH